MKKALNILIVISILIFLKLLSAFTLNEIIIKNYNNQNYDTSLTNLLYFINISEPYIAYYNHGNQLYQQNEYEKAIQKYTIALEKNPPQKRVCNIQINLSLAKLKTIDINDKDNALKNLKEARETLYDNHCADPNDSSGESEKAEELEKEIKDLEQQLGGNETDPNQKENDPENQDPNEKENQKDKETEEKLKEQRKEAIGSRQENLDKYKGKTEYGYFGKRW